ncbi:MAG: metallophosphoesterase [Chrysiogenales bacterium]|nr:MAG: metallophosphoesterase [Chrysiogenales bacterium]
MYGMYLTLASALLLAYVLWRVSSIPRFRKIPRPAFLFAALFLALLLFLGRFLGHDASGSWATLFEFLSMTLVGSLFLVFTCLFPVDLLLGFGRFFPRRAAQIRGWAMFAGCLLALLALFQGLRPPVVVRYEVRLPGLPQTLDGTRLAAISDLHLGALIGPKWLQARVSQVQALKPDMILVLGDIFEGHGTSTADFFPALRRLQAPLGVWAVDGNHGSHGSPSGSAAEPAESPLRTLRDDQVQPAPGLFLAGRGHLSRHDRQQTVPEWNPNGKHAIGALILMAHVPAAAKSAARAGVGLMLSGHTHGGQIWPLSIATRMVNPLLAGRYEIEGMTVLVSRGTGTWGPRMRLWPPGEIMVVTLRSQ